jgi:corrinoid protein of di/trimethylamine methyltransferase
MATKILEKLREAVLEYDVEAAANWARKAIEEQIEPTKTIDALAGAIRQVGDGFGKGELWLPDLVAAAEAMLAGMAIMEEELKRRGESMPSLGCVVIGTAFGDIHSIGKDLVATLLTAEGFQVHDLGINIPSEVFIGAVKEQRADILAMSALLTTTAAEQQKVISALNEQGLRKKVKVMVGGGPITQEFANSIGADGYAPTAFGAARLARSLLGK